MSLTLGWLLEGWQKQGRTLSELEMPERLGQMPKEDRQRLGEVDTPDTRESRKARLLIGFREQAWGTRDGGTAWLKSSMVAVLHQAKADSRRCWVRTPLVGLEHPKQGGPDECGEHVSQSGGKACRELSALLIVEHGVLCGAR